MSEQVGRSAKGAAELIGGDLSVPAEAVRQLASGTILRIGKPGTTVVP